MTTGLRSAAVDDTLARAFADLAGGPGDLASVTIPVPALDALALFEAGAAYDARSYIEQPAQAFSLVALGSAAEIRSEGSRRFAEMSAAWRKLAAETTVSSSSDCPLAAPVALGGFSFAGGGSATWAGFPEAALTVPRLLFVTTNAGAWLIATSRRNEVESLVEELAAVRARVVDTTAEVEATSELRMSDGTPPDDWKQTVGTIVERINDSDLRKLVLAREVVALSGEDLQPLPALRRLRSRYERCTTFAFAHGSSCFMGATPERLVRLDGRTARVDSLAGTAPRGATKEEDAAIGAALLHDAKEREEHQLVVDALRETLAPIASALDIPDEPRLLTMPNVQHLETPIEATLADGQNVIDLAALLHPTPAAGGVPQRAACDLIDTYEPFDRGWYAGPVGWTDARGDGEFVVAIRSALLRGREARLYAGCGIVAGSDPDREFEESRMKLEPMRWALSGTNS